MLLHSNPQHNMLLLFIIKERTRVQVLLLPKPA